MTHRDACHATMPMPRIKPLKMPDLDPRADRVKAIIESLFGSVISRDRNTMIIEAPADLLGATCRSLGMGGFTWTIGPQTSRMTTKRMTDTSGRFVVCEGHQELMAFFAINVDLRPRDAKVFDPADPLAAHPTVANITRQSSPPCPTSTPFSR